MLELHRRGAVAVLTAAALALGACGGDGDPPADDAGDATEPTVDDGGSSPVPTDDGDDVDVDVDGTDAGSSDDGDADGTGGEDGSSDDQASDVPALDAEASTDDREVEAGPGAGVTLTDVRVGSHDGFDRVTFEVAGDGELGWSLRWTDQANEQGSGRAVDVAGDAVLTVGLRGVLLPPERPDDLDAFDRDRLPAPSGAPVLTEVVDSNVFEGIHQLFVGATDEVPFRVVRYEDPQRLVIDLVHP